MMELSAQIRGKGQVAGSVGSDVEQELEHAIVSGRAGAGPASWDEVATRWCGLRPTMESRRAAFDAIRRLSERGIVEADYDWYGIVSIEVRHGITAEARDSINRSPRDQFQDWRQLIVNIFGNVGNVNTGTVLGNMETSIQMLNQSGHESIGRAVKQLVDAISQSEELSADAKAEALQQLAGLSQQATVPAEQRNRGTLRALMSALKDTLSVTGSLASIWSACAPLLKAHFGL